MLFVRIEYDPRCKPKGWRQRKMAAQYDGILARLLSYIQKVVHHRLQEVDRAEDIPVSLDLNDVKVESCPIVAADQPSKVLRVEIWLEANSQYDTHRDELREKIASDILGFLGNSAEFYLGFAYLRLKLVFVASASGIQVVFNERLITGSWGGHTEPKFGTQVPSHYRP